MIAGIPDWAEETTAAYVAGETPGGLDTAGLITIIVISIIAIVAFVWIFRETGKRD